MIECINQLLEFIINIAIVVGIIFLIYLYARLKYLDSKIEKIHRNFEKERGNSRNRHAPMFAIDGEIGMLEEKRDEDAASLERERQRILSKIPFMK